MTANTLEGLADLVLAQQTALNHLVAQNTAFRVALCALIAAHPDKPTLAAIANRAQDVSSAKSLYVAAPESVLNETQHVLAELFRPIAGEQ